MRPLGFGKKRASALDAMDEEKNVNRNVLYEMVPYHPVVCFHHCHSVVNLTPDLNV